MNDKCQRISCNEELKKCDFVKVFLMLFVILGHSTALWSSGGWFNQAPAQKSAICLWTIRFIGNFHIYGFVLVSGYIFSYLKFEKDKYNDFSKFIINKSKRLLLPYVFVAIIWVIPWNIYFFNTSILKIVKDYFIGLSPAQLWFLLMLFNVFVIAYYLIPIFYNKLWLGATFCLVIHFIGAAGIFLLPNYFQLLSSLQFFIFFYIGVQIRHFGTAIFRKIPNIVYIVIYILLLIFYVEIGNSDALLLKYMNLVVGMVLHIWGSVSAFVILTSYDSIRIMDNSCFAFFKNNSFSMYMFHQQVIYVVITLLNGVIHPVIISTVSFLFSVIISAAISWIVSTNKYTKALIGMK